MIKLHLVGFTTDLRNLIFARRRGEDTGNYLLEIDERLRRTLVEVDRLEEEVRAGRVPEALADAVTEAEPEPPPPPHRPSKLSPKEIQSLLREGKTPEQVARMADTDLSWIERFTGPILGERATIVDAVKAGWISKPRLGRSAIAVGDAVVMNLQERHIVIPQEILDEGWTAVRRDGHWQVTFRYLSRGRAKEASFSFDPATREIRPVNSLASELGWRSSAAAGDTTGETRPRRRRTGGSGRGAPPAKGAATKPGSGAKAPRSAAPRSAAPRSAAPRSAAPRSAAPRSAAPGSPAEAGSEAPVAGMARKPRTPRKRAPARKDSQRQPAG